MRVHLVLQGAVWNGLGDIGGGRAVSGGVAPQGGLGHRDESLQGLQSALNLALQHDMSPGEAR